MTSHTNRRRGLGQPQFVRIWDQERSAWLDSVVVMALLSVDQLRCVPRAFKHAHLEGHGVPATHLFMFILFYTFSLSRRT
jgi:hypothetical protein